MERVQHALPVIRPANVRRFSCGEALATCGQSGAPLAATNVFVGGREMQAA
jgi:hypothetical protein